MVTIHQQYKLTNMDPGVVFIDAFYEQYEFTDGDGFYPSPKMVNNMTSHTLIGFALRDNEWVQVSGHYIYGLDGPFGPEYLQLLNENLTTSDDLQVTTKMCISNMKRNGATERVLSTPLNDLSRSDFAYRVIDEMMSCAWQPQAEYILSLIGLGGYETKLPTVIRNKGMEILYSKP